uniref:phosphotransferase n=1 Tax=Lachnoclostridium sp. TaxID=2028282 RepID=UPI002899961D
FMKVIPSAFMDTAKQSLSVISFLTKNGFPSPRIINTKEGLPYVEIDEFDKKTLIVLFEFIEGREPNEGEDIEKIGELVAQLHNTIQKYQELLPEHGKEFFIDRYLRILEQKNYDQSKINMFREYGNVLWENVKNLPRGYSHGDLHRGNLLRTTTGKYYILDFDTPSYAFPLYDIMIMCNSTDYFNFNENGYENSKNGYENSKNTYESFLKGYKKYRSLSEEELNSFYDLIAVYHYQLQATIVEIYGLNCIDVEFLDNQLNWLMKWREQCSEGLIT